MPEFIKTILECCIVDHLQKGQVHALFFVCYVSAGMRQWWGPARVYDSFVQWVWMNLMQKDANDDMKRVELACH